MPTDRRQPGTGRQQTTRQRDVQQQADNHAHTREAMRRALAEDYVEVIADLIDTGGEARAVDIAKRIGVSHVTVVKNVERLQRDGLVTSRPYRSIFLTDEGRALAESTRRRHSVVLRFLLAIGVTEKTAQADAEGIEHHVSEETLRAFARLVEQGPDALRPSAPSTPKS